MIDLKEERRIPSILSRGTNPPSSSSRLRRKKAHFLYLCKLETAVETFHTNKVIRQTIKGSRNRHFSQLCRNASLHILLSVDFILTVRTFTALMYLYKNGELDR